jgi:hypothetical protein
LHPEQNDSVGKGGAAHERIDGGFGVHI